MTISRSALLLTALFLLVPVAPAAAREAWPPVGGAGHLFAHFGEEHWDDEDGMALLPKVVADTARYHPALVTMSADKSSDGTVENLGKWLELMQPYDRAGVPFLAAVGNHDRKAPVGGETEGAFPVAASFENYRNTFASRPYPMGDGKPYADPLFAPKTRPETDPAGASSHYFADYGDVRWVFLDNSCWSFETCDSDQYPSLQSEGHATQLDYLAAVATEGKSQGKTVFVVMHIPTQDPRDQDHVSTISRSHTMGKGIAPDNEAFEQVAEETGVDGVFLGHIKGQFLYRGRGDVRYYIDGGAGGELYTNGPVGTDHGYWHGYRLLRADRGAVMTDAVPIFVPNGISVASPQRLTVGETSTFTATGKQPAEHGPKVEALELRDPDPVAKSGARNSEQPDSPGSGGTPTATPKESLPSPARIWTTLDRRVLAPVASVNDDSRRDRRTQTADGEFRAVCPGRGRVRINSGWSRRTGAWVSVASTPGRIARSIRRGPRVIQRGKKNRVATIRLAQPARTKVNVRRGKRLIQTLSHRCHDMTSKALLVHWRGRRGKRSLKPGTYTIEAHVKSDRRTTTRRWRVRLR